MVIHFFEEDQFLGLMGSFSQSSSSSSREAALASLTNGTPWPSDITEEASDISVAADLDELTDMILATKEGKPK